MKPNSPLLSLMNSAASEPPAIPMPLSASTVKSRGATRPAKRRSGANSASPTTSADTKFNRNSVPIVGTAR